MRKWYKGILMLLLAAAAAAGSAAQTVETLPADPRIRTGSLANGLSYYIVRNPADAGRADFYLIQKTGTVLEEKGHRGMFKLLERLALKGTRHFDDSTTTAFFRSLGIGPRGRIFDTREDDITYRVENVPVTNSNTIDSTLLLLYNWMGSINIDEEDIVEEMPYLKNRLSAASGPGPRMEARLMEELFPGSPYAEILDPSALEDPDGFTSREIRSFYYKWFRPDFQAVAVIGDVDLEPMETRIKSVFSTIRKPLQKQERPYYTPGVSAGVKAFVLRDKEYDKVRVQADYLKSPLPDSLRNTGIPFIQRYINTSICQVLEDRMKEGALSQGIPMAEIRVKMGKFQRMQNVETVSVTFETVPDMVYSCLSFTKGEIDRLKEYGFTNKEFMATRDLFLRNLQFLYDTRDQADNGMYLKRVRDSYLEHYSLASIELEYEMTREIYETITRSEVEGYIRMLFDQTDDIVLVCRMPDLPGIEAVSPRRMRGAFSNALALAQPADGSADVLQWPRETRSGTSSRVVSEVTDPETGARTLILSNGATVIFKKTEGSKDTVAFRAVSRGGLSLLEEATLADESFINGMLNLGGLGTVSGPGWERLFAYENLFAAARIFPEREEIAGWGLSGNAEKLFQLLSLHFLSRREDDNAFELYKKRKAAESAYAGLSPAEIFRDSVNACAYSNRRYMTRPSVSDIGKKNYAVLFPALKNRFSNAADFTFVFAGNTDDHRFRDWAVRYIGSIPGDVSRRENWMVVPNYFTKGQVNKHFLHQMEQPRTYMDVTYSVGCPYQLENLLLGRLLESYLRSRLETMPVGNYAPDSRITARMHYYPEERFALNLRTSVPDLARAEEISGAVDSVLREIARGEMLRPVFEAAVSSLEQQYENDIRENGYWLETLGERYLTGKDFHSHYLPGLKEVTPERFETFVRALTGGGNRVKVVMEGTTDDVDSPDLLKDNAFIRNFFEGWI